MTFRYAPPISGSLPPLTQDFCLIPAATHGKALRLIDLAAALAESWLAKYPFLMSDPYFQ